MVCSGLVRKISLSKLASGPGRLIFPLGTILPRFFLFMGNSSSQSMASPFVIPPTGKHTATVIFLHGLGDTGQGWSSAFEMIKEPHIKYVCPNAPISPVTLNGGFRMPSWFDIKGLSHTADEDDEGIKRAADTVQSLVDEEVSKGIQLDRIVVGGFSQGGAAALYNALTSKKGRVGGVLALSTWMPLNKEFPQAAVNQDLTILQCHGTSDPMVSYKFGMLTCKLLEQLTGKHEFKSYENMGHMSCQQEMDDVKDFLKKVLPAAKE